MQAMGYYVTHQQTPQYSVMTRAAITSFIKAPYLAARICRDPENPNGRMFDHVAALASQCGGPKYSDITSKLWELHGQNTDWLSSPINLTPRKDRAVFLCQPDVYDMRHAPASTLIVDFANRHVGGGSFSSGFVQEEQLVMQSLDLTARLAAHRPHLNWSEAVTFEGIHFDAWWPREISALKADIPLHEVQPRTSPPMTVIAVNAPVVNRRYDAASLQMLACKIALIYAAAVRLHSPVIYTGLLGGGAFRNNRPLVLLLHLLLQPHHDHCAVEFHHPIFMAFSYLSTAQLEQAVLDRADILLHALVLEGVHTLGDALDVIESWDLATSHHDLDLI